MTLKSTQAVQLAQIRLSFSSKNDRHASALKASVTPFASIVQHKTCYAVVISRVNAWLVDVSDHPSLLMPTDAGKAVGFKRADRGGASVVLLRTALCVPTDLSDEKLPMAAAASDSCLFGPPTGLDPCNGRRCPDPPGPLLHVCSAGKPLRANEKRVGPAGAKERSTGQLFGTTRPLLCFVCLTCLAELSFSPAPDFRQFTRSSLHTDNDRRSVFIERGDNECGITKSVDHHRMRKCIGLVLTPPFSSKTLATATRPCQCAN